MAPTPSSSPPSPFSAYISSYTAPIQPTVTSTTARWSNADPRPPARSNTYNGSSTVKDTVGTLFGLTRCRNTWPSVSGADPTAVPSEALSSLRSFNVMPGHTAQARHHVRVGEDRSNKPYTDLDGTRADTEEGENKGDDAATANTTTGAIEEPISEYYSFPPYLTPEEWAESKRVMNQSLVDSEV